MSQIATKPEDNQNCLGVVLDATGAYKTYDSTDYVTKLKIIDPSFNSLSNKTNYKDFVQIFIYTSTAAEAPRVARIGDIIRLKGFDVNQIFFFFIQKANFPPNQFQFCLNFISPSNSFFKTFFSLEPIKIKL